MEDLDFDSVLDAFGGTGSVSLMFKRHGKRVLYNDLLKSNQLIGKAIVENNSITVTEDDLNMVLESVQDECPTFIQREFQGIFFTDDENIWLDRIVSNISETGNEYKRAILMAALFQACLAKRPFNLFHRANLYLRTSDVPRSFGNKTTWETSFPTLLRRYVAEYNQAVFSNGRGNRVIGGYDVVESPNGVDLVYLDPPYFPDTGSYGTNYLAFYHFLEGLSDYETWVENRESLYGKTKRIPDSKGIQRFTRRSQLQESFEEMLERFQDSIIVLSYQDEGVPTRSDINLMLTRLGKAVTVFERPHSYALSRKQRTELLFVGA